MGELNDYYIADVNNLQENTENNIRNWFAKILGIKKPAPRKIKRPMDSELNDLWLSKKIKDKIKD